MRRVEIFAIRTRELSEAVATLHVELTAGKASEQTLSEIKRLRALAESAGNDLFAWIEPSENQLS
jgi:hypothetical protein